VQAIGVAHQDGEELGRVVVVAPVEDRAVARRATVEPARQHLERADEDVAERLGQGFERCERSEALGEIPEAEQVVRQVEAVDGAELPAAVGMIMAGAAERGSWALPTIYNPRTTMDWTADEGLVRVCAFALPMLCR